MEPYCRNLQQAALRAWRKGRGQKESGKWTSRFCWNQSPCQCRYVRAKRESDNHNPMWVCRDCWRLHQCEEAVCRYLDPISRVCTLTGKVYPYSIDQPGKFENENEAREHHYHENVAPQLRLQHQERRQQLLTDSATREEMIALLRMLRLPVRSRMEQLVLTAEQLWETMHARRNEMTFKYDAFYHATVVLYFASKPGGLHHHNHSQVFIVPSKRIARALPEEYSSLKQALGVRLSKSLFFRHSSALCAVILSSSSH
jgi:hypothetical protein